jgi:hypothetical protein
MPIPSLPATMSFAFLLTSLVMGATPGTGALFTVSAGLSPGVRASLVAAFGCTLGIVEAPLMAELDNLILTAGHDLDTVSGSLQADASRDGDRYLTLNGKTAELRAGDILRRNAGHRLKRPRGPDQRTPSPNTRARHARSVPLNAAKTPEQCAEDAGDAD